MQNDPAHTPAPVDAPPEDAPAPAAAPDPEPQRVEEGTEAGAQADETQADQTQADETQAAETPPGDDAAGDDAAGDDAAGDEAAPDDPSETDPSETDPSEEGPPVGAEKGKKKRKGRKSKEKSSPAWTPPPPERLEGAIEAVLLVAGDVVRFERLRDLLGLQSVLPLREAVATIQERWAASGLAMELEEVGGGVRVVTRPEYAEYVSRLQKRPQSDKLSKTQLETLCIVAYKQPVGRAEVERIRGVQAGEPLRALLERRLVKVVGRSDQPGRPLLYGTTQLFLTAFGLNDVKDLPSAKDLSRL